ncbi:nicotinate-nucleotide adenylyltransferase [Reichenbachiella versicolor]|uniref:nicotinate-nucleotide adenylyltransferase n=1 Tax=Reichenbachiella versicolor TaxID=1821036 RepID=UPI000D6EA115|nr:nicotinate-nucleotide adenylyltransferase [Reichenbachiella versicolor]
MENGVHTTKEKALSLNLRPDIYGTIAEIGGGQETAANFFRAGGASGTIAKTMSAYDMKFSDAIYGKTDRYVCEEKLHKMLGHEYSLLAERLGHRADDTLFFAFANTVETLNYKKTNQGNGWLGVKFQLTPNSEPNICIIHVVLRDPDAIWQQEALGRAGINLIYACFNHRNDPERLMTSIRDNLSHDRLDVDMFKLRGPDFRPVDNRLMALKLVKHGLSQAAMFDKDGEVQQPSSLLYKKNICVLRGQFTPVTYRSVDMMVSGVNQFQKDTEVDPKRVQVLAEFTLSDLATDGEIDDSDFLDRVSQLNALGQHVMISNFDRLHQLASYLKQYSRGKRMGLIVGSKNLTRIFDKDRHETLNGGILEAFSHLFGSNAKLLIYPTSTSSKACNFKPSEDLKYLYQHFTENGFIDDIEEVRDEYLSIDSEKVLKLIKAGDNSWKDYVPSKVRSLVEEKEMFAIK